MLQTLCKDGVSLVHKCFQALTIENHVGQVIQDEKVIDKKIADIADMRLELHNPDLSEAEKKSLVEKINGLVAEVNTSTKKPQLSRLRKENPQDMERAIKLLFVDLGKSLNMGDKGLNPTMIDELAIFIPQDFYWLHLEDIYIFCQQVKRGKFGTMYESLNTVKLMGYLKKYDEERQGLIGNIRLKDHVQMKAQTPGSNIRNEDFDFRGAFRDALQKKFNSGIDTTINELPAQDTPKE